MAKIHVRIAIEDYRDTMGSLEWALELDGVLVASGDCTDEADGRAKADRALDEYLCAWTARDAEQQARHDARFGKGVYAGRASR